MRAVLGSSWFIVWAALCCAVTVGFATWVAGGTGLGSFLLGLAIGLVLAFAAPVAVFGLADWAAESPASPSPAVAASPPAPTRVPVPAPVAVPVASPPAPSGLRAEVERLRAEGEALRADPEGGRVDAWIARTQGVLAREAPGIGRYFGALSSRPLEGTARLEAHLARLDTILRDFL